MNEAVGAIRPAIERVVLLYHPKYNDQAEFCRQEFLSSGIGEPAVDLPTRDGGVETNIELLQKVVKLEEGDAVAVVGGDGTFRSIAGGLSRLAVANTFVTSLRGGHANDVRRALHGGKPVLPSKILKESVAVPSSMLECVIEYDNGLVTTHLATSYCGWEITGRAARRLYNMHSLKGRQSKIEDIKTLWQVIKSHRSFLYTPTDGSLAESGSLIFGNGPRMSRYGRLPIEYWDESYVSIETGASLGALALGAARVAAGRARCTYHTKPFGFECHTSTVAQFDGEPVAVPSHSKITVALSSDKYYLGTTRLAAVV
ncbi:MAG TPA: diacylglycerol kinase family protein [Patescibacteria group bacterium]|nr:diacylglycerol kinase family protein [Patescibacteria group bacterium]